VGVDVGPAAGADVDAGAGADMDAGAGADVDVGAGAGASPGAGGNIRRNLFAISLPCWPSVSTRSMSSTSPVLKMFSLKAVGIPAFMRTTSVSVKDATCSESVGRSSTLSERTP